MGSKQNLIPFILSHVEKLKFRTALDAFSGSGCVSYALKQTGAEVITNDFMRFCYHIARATVENNRTQLSDNDVGRLMQIRTNAPDFIRKNYDGVFFNYEDCLFLDNLWLNIQDLSSPLKRSIAFASAVRACMKKRPRGIFTVVGRKGWDGRRDLRISMKEQFLEAIKIFNQSVFSNGKSNKAFCRDVFELNPKGMDLVYIDTPYISPFSDCDYIRRYHFVEGFCSYWKDLDLMHHTKTKKIRSYPTLFSKKQNALMAFEKLFDHFKNSILVVSYSSNSIPDKASMANLLRRFKRRVEVFERSHKYSHGNHNHKVGVNNNSVYEYLFVAQ